jgi:hypothetical protein
MAPCRYVVELGSGADQTYWSWRRIAEGRIARGDNDNSQVTIFRKLEAILEVLILNDPFNCERALSGSLANIFRVTADPIRVYYCGSPSLPKISVFYITDAPLKNHPEFLKKWKDTDALLAAYLEREFPDANLRESLGFNRERQIRSVPSKLDKGRGLAR